MDFMEIIKSRRTIRFFKQDSIGDEVLLELVEAARLASQTSVELIAINREIADGPTGAKTLVDLDGRLGHRYGAATSRLRRNDGVAMNSLLRA